MSNRRVTVTRDSEVAINAMPSRVAGRAVSEILSTLERGRERERDPISQGLGQARSI